MECFDFVLAPSNVASFASLLCLLFFLSLSMIFDGLVLLSSRSDWAEELRLDFLVVGVESETFAAAALKREVRVVLIGTEVEAVARFSSEEDLRWTEVSSEGGQSLLARLEFNKTLH